MLKPMHIYVPNYCMTMTDGTYPDSAHIILSYTMTERVLYLSAMTRLLDLEDVTFKTQGFEFGELKPDKLFVRDTNIQTTMPVLHVTAETLYMTSTVLGTNHRFHTRGYDLQNLAQHLEECAS